MVGVISSETVSSASGAVDLLEPNNLMNESEKPPGQASDPVEDQESDEEEAKTPPPKEKFVSWTYWTAKDIDASAAEIKARVKSKAASKNKRKFDKCRLEQIISHHKGPIWTLKFNMEGKFLATGGQDAIIRVWTVVGSSRDRARWKHKANTTNNPEEHPLRPPKGAIINPIPFREYAGHTSDVIDLDWSKDNDFILSSSFDRTVMLWHFKKDQCLGVYHHDEVVTSVRFHPNDPTFFVTASLDSMIRMWNIMDHCVVSFAQTPDVDNSGSEATAATFSPNGKFIATGLINGTTIFYSVHEQTHRDGTKKPSKLVQKRWNVGTGRVGERR